MNIIIVLICWNISFKFEYPPCHNDDKEKDDNDEEDNDDDKDDKEVQTCPPC